MKYDGERGGRSKRRDAKEEIMKRKKMKGEKLISIIQYTRPISLSFRLSIMNEIKTHISRGSTLNIVQT